MAHDRWQTLSIIVPVGPEEGEYVHLLSDLKRHFRSAEIICVFPAGKKRSIPNVRCLTAATGRASQLNAGAQAACGDVFWFLHADTRVDHPARCGVQAAMKNMLNALSYFNLTFVSQTHRSYRINAWGAGLRSRLFLSPFGDQGFLISRKNFLRIGGFPVTAPYGEDHLFAWRARQQGIPVRCTGQTISTSARKYEQYGRLRLMRLYLLLWIKQVIPESFRYLRSRGVL
ncbi:MAG: hypothetical protein ACE5D8_06380 [Fidelibacterota bacterium]